MTELVEAPVHPVGPELCRWGVGSVRFGRHVLEGQPDAAHGDDG